MSIFEGQEIAFILMVIHQVDNGFNAFPVALCRRSCDPYCEVIDECYRSSVAVNSSLYEVGIEEEKQDRRQRRALREARLWQASDLCGLSVDLDRCCAFRAECLCPSEKLLWYTSRSHPLE